MLREESATLRFYAETFREESAMLRCYMETFREASITLRFYAKTFREESATLRLCVEADDGHDHLKYTQQQAFLQKKSYIRAIPGLAGDKEHEG
jgi:hypothetical protein